MDHQLPEELPARPNPPPKKSSFRNGMSRLLRSPAVDRRTKVLARAAEAAVVAAAAKEEEKKRALSLSDSDSAWAESVASSDLDSNKPEPALAGTELDDEDRAKTGARMSAAARMNISQMTDEEKAKEITRARDTRAPSGHYFLGVFRPMDTSPGYFGYNAAKGMTGK